MPFFDYSGKEIPQEECESLHVYSPATKVLTRNQLHAAIVNGEYSCETVDPSDFRPLSDGPLEGLVLLVARNDASLEGLPRHRVRAKLLAEKEIVFVDVIVECPFDATQVFGPLDGLAETFGTEGLRHLERARTMYSLNLPRQTSPLAGTVLAEVARRVAMAVGGAIYDCEEGRFIE